MMRTIQSITLSRLVLLYAAILVCGLFLAGCLEQARTASSAGSALNQSDVAFQEHRNRPPSAKTLYAMADILVTQRKDRECELVLKRIIQEYPQFLPAYNSLAELQMRQSHVRQAIDTLSKGLRIHPQDAVQLNNLGICLLVCEDYDKALEIFTKAAGIVPENARYRANMAVTLGLMGRFGDSRFLFSQVLPEDQATHNLEVLRQAAESANTDSDRHDVTG